ncbi:unnamed protein product [Meloidogyne enterolobii]|uniref:Uncharacterized protein n=1 Tax=Meloidogyne enterolobii TaxID=390850 RepID=A0ACB0YWX7_MELEN
MDRHGPKYRVGPKIFVPKKLIRPENKPARLDKNKSKNMARKNAAHLENGNPTRTLSSAPSSYT